jgi:hypothetical protein
MPIFPPERLTRPPFRVSGRFPLDHPATGDLAPQVFPETGGENYRRAELLARVEGIHKELDALQSCRSVRFADESFDKAPEAISPFLALRSVGFVLILSVKLLQLLYVFDR